MAWTGLAGCRRRGRRQSAPDALSQAKPLFDLHKRITDDLTLGEALKDFLFDQYLRAHRNAEELIRRGESKTLEFKSTLRWS